MKRAKKILAGILALTVLAPACAVPAGAAAPAVSTDEAVYANLDYYGKAEQISVVKGSSLNGNRRFTDFGSYDKVTNMTNGASPVLSANSVSWNLPKQGTDRFYYECTPKKGTVVLPWSFDVSYKLNGVPARAESLAGASGTVEIDVKAAPDKNAPDYYRNNLLLTVGTYVKMADTLSLEAPGAQVQSLGDYKAALFAALPGEEKTFTLRIGTKSFETPGIVMMMVPAAADQLDKVTDLKDAKDTVKDSLDDANAAVNRILGTLESMDSGLRETQSGLEDLDDARGTISSGKGKVYADADRSLADLTQTANRLNAMVPHIRKSQQLVRDLNADANASMKTISDMKPTVTALSSSLGEVRGDLSRLRAVLNDTEEDREDAKDDLEDLLDDIRDSLGEIEDLRAAQSGLNSNAKKLSGTLEGLTDLLNKNPTFQQELIQKIMTYTGITDPQQAAAMLTGLIQQLQSTNKSVLATGDALTDALGEAEDFADLGDEALDTIDDTLDLLDKGVEPSKSLLSNLSGSLGDLQTLLGQSNGLIDDLNGLNGTLNQYEDGTIRTLKDSETLTYALAGGLADARSFLSSLEILTKTSGTKLDSGTKQSLNGLIRLLQKSLDGVGDLSAVKDAANTIHGTLDDKIDDLENDSNLLKIDPNAPIVSITSSRNPSPSSLQIVLRTREISRDEGKAAEKDLETGAENSNVFERIGRIFSKLWSAVAGAFSGS